MIFQEIQQKLKLIFIILILIFIIGCDSQKQPSKKKKMSAGQMCLNNLRDSLKIEYGQAKSENDKNVILQKYHERLGTFLFENRLDSIRVSVDEVIKDSMTIITRLHDNDIEFKYSLKFGDDTMSERVLKVYNFINGLKPGTDTITSFSFTGAFKINRPDDKSVPTFRIFAFPIPLEFNGE